MFHRLDPERIVVTARSLARRVLERFPDAGLARVAEDLVAVCERTAREQPWLGRPLWGLRIGVGLCIGLLLLVFVMTVVAVLRLPAGPDATAVIQAIDAGVNELIFLGVAIFFLSTLEIRRKRKRALRAIHELRSMAHIIDMHQLTKDPERVANPEAGSDTPSSPIRSMSVFELSRYLDYCSEMLSILSKAAALYAQDFEDSVTLAAVNDVETLTSGLAHKIWQKIMILDHELAG